MTSLDLAQQRLREFAEEAAGISPLYEHLASRAAEDPEVADLLTAASEDNATGELLLAAGRTARTRAPGRCSATSCWSAATACGRWWLRR